jgi:acetyl-CoA synthetase
MANLTMSSPPRLAAYHFHEQDWDGYDDLYESFEWQVPDQFNIADYIVDRWANDAGRVALFAQDNNGNERIYTYRQLSHITNRLANYFVDQGIETGDRISISGAQKPEVLMAHVAAWKIGAVSIPMSTRFGPQALEYRLFDSKTSAVVFDAAMFDTFESINKDLDGIDILLNFGSDERGTDFWDAVDNQTRSFENVDTSAEDPACIIYTSGTTGSPKGTVLPHRVFLGQLPQFLLPICDLEINESDIIWTPVEWAWVGSISFIIVSSLYYGLPVLAYDGGQFDPRKAFRLIEKYGITTGLFPPTAIRMMMEVENPTERYDLSSLRAIMSGGEAVGPSINGWVSDIIDEAKGVNIGFGQTEADGLIMTSNGMGVTYRENRLGKPTPGHDIEIVDPDTAEPTVETGEVGEIAVRYEGNPLLFKEYLNNKEKTDKKVKNGWMLTEDLGVKHKDGYISFKGRKDDIIISSGYKIGPEEVEEAVTTHAAVADAAVIGIPDDTRGEVPKAFVVTQGENEHTKSLADELSEHVKDELAKYEYPREIEFIDELPKTSTGKVKRSELESD